MKLKLVAIVLLLVVGVAAVVVTLGGLPKTAAASSTFLTATAEIQDVRDDVAATGSVAWCGWTSVWLASRRSSGHERTPPRRPQARCR